MWPPPGLLVITNQFGKEISNMHQQAVYCMRTMKDSRPDIVLKDVQTITKTPKHTSEPYLDRLKDYGDIVVSFLEKNMSCPDDGVLILIPFMQMIISHDATNIVKTDFSERIQAALQEGMETAKICLTEESDFAVNNAVTAIACVPHVMELGGDPNELVKVAAPILVPEIENMRDCVPFEKAMKNSASYITKLPCAAEDENVKVLLAYLKDIEEKYT